MHRAVTTISEPRWRISSTTWRSNKKRRSAGGSWASQGDGYPTVPPQYLCAVLRNSGHRRILTTPNHLVRVRHISLSHLSSPPHLAFTQAILTSSSDNKSENARGVSDLSNAEMYTPVWAISVLKPGSILPYNGNKANYVTECAIQDEK